MKHTPPTSRPVENAIHALCLFRFLISTYRSNAPYMDTRIGYTYAFAPGGKLKQCDSSARTGILKELTFAARNMSEITHTISTHLRCGDTVNTSDMYARGAYHYLDEYDWMDISDAIKESAAEVIRTMSECMRLVFADLLPYENYPPATYGRGQRASYERASIKYTQYITVMHAFIHDVDIVLHVLSALREHVTEQWAFSVNRPIHRPLHKE